MGTLTSASEAMIQRAVSCMDDADTASDLKDAVYLVGMAQCALLMGLMHEISELREVQSRGD